MKRRISGLVRVGAGRGGGSGRLARGTVLDSALTWFLLPGTFFDN